MNIYSSILYYNAGADARVAPKQVALKNFPPNLIDDPAETVI